MQKKKLSAIKLAQLTRWNVNVMQREINHEREANTMVKTIYRNYYSVKKATCYVQDLQIRTTFEVRKYLYYKCKYKY